MIYIECTCNLRPQNVAAEQLLAKNLRRCYQLIKSGHTAVYENFVKL